jgi:hypothetical protein
MKPGYLAPGPFVATRIVVVDSTKNSARAAPRRLYPLRPGPARRPDFFGHEEAAPGWLEIAGRHTRPRRGRAGERRSLPHAIGKRLERSIDEQAL